MRFTDATPSVTDVLWFFVQQVAANATAVGERALNSTLEAVDDLSGARVLDALVVAVEPGKPVSVGMGVLCLLVTARALAVRRAARGVLSLHQKLE